MFPRKFNFDSSEIKEAFSTKTITHKSNWEFYYSQYNYLFSVIINEGLSEQYIFNSKSRGLLFLLQHTLELCLKYNAEKQNLDNPLSHDLEKLVEAFGKDVVPSSISEAITEMKVDESGSSYRYLLNRSTGKRYYDNTDKIYLANIIRLLNEAQSSSGFILKPISDGFDYTDKYKVWDLTLHLGESISLGGVRHEFDDTLNFIIELLIEGKLLIKDVYLPLLFMVRHSIELALKSNITDVQGLSKKIKDKDYQGEHSIMRLFNVYKDYLDGLDLSKLDDTLKQQHAFYLDSFEELTDEIHQLDTHSRAFRYSIQKDGSPHKVEVDKINILKIVKLLYFTDTFITFNNVVLSEAGVDY